MKVFLLVAVAAGASYQLGASLGHALGVQHGIRKADQEWARMLENGMVGPGTTEHPLRGAR
jgi:hypothetical protein